MFFLSLENVKNNFIFWIYFIFNLLNNHNRIKLEIVFFLILLHKNIRAGHGTFVFSNKSIVIIEPSLCPFGHLATLINGHSIPHTAGHFTSRPVIFCVLHVQCEVIMGTGT